MCHRTGNPTELRHDRHGSRTPDRSGAHRYRIQRWSRRLKAITKPTTTATITMPSSGEKIGKVLS